MTSMGLLILMASAGAVYWFAASWLGWRPIDPAELGRHVRSHKAAYLWPLAAMVLLQITDLDPHSQRMLLILTIPAAVILFGVFWSREFRILMALEDDDFPGRHDKLIWALALIALAPIAVWTFRVYRLQRWQEAVKPVGDALGDLA